MSSPFRRAMFGSESSGDYGETGSDSGHYGGYQFGDARLSEFADFLGRPVSREEFISNPRMQEQAMDWHESDILDYIEKKDLGKYLGSTIKGTKITEGSLLAMAHLGGRAGMATYLRSDGEIDKQDKYKTRMSDYARKFSPFSITDDVSSVAEPEVTLEAFVPTANDEAESDLANIAFENMTDEDIVMAQAVKPSGITSGAASGVDPQMQAIAAAVMEAKKGDPKAKGFRAMQMGLGMLDKDIQPMLEQLSSLQVPQRPPSAMDRFTGGIASLKDSIGNMFRMGN